MCMYVYVYAYIRVCKGIIMLRRVIGSRFGLASHSPVISSRKHKESIRPIQSLSLSFSSQFFIERATMPFLERAKKMN